MHRERGGEHFSRVGQQCTKEMQIIKLNVREWPGLIEMRRTCVGVNVGVCAWVCVSVYTETNILTYVQRADKI